MKIDHVSVGAHDLGILESAFKDAGMAAEYGGPHSSGLTKMSLLGFRDGSYIELISKARPDSEPSIWRKQIEQDGGPCAWAVEVENISTEVERARALGIPVSGPTDYSRKRPDGVSVDWQLAFLGREEPGALLPFLIKDTTPRSLRVKPSPSVAGPDSPLRGISHVVIGVEKIRESAELFEKLYGWKEPAARTDLWDGVSLAQFVGSPVVLAAPSRSGWLEDRISKFGTSPCAFLVGSVSLEGASKKYRLGKSEDWFEAEEMCWIDPLEKKGMMIGVVGR